MNPFKFVKVMLTPVARLAPVDCKARLKSGKAVLVDIREPSEWKEGVAASAVLLPMSDLNGSRSQWKPFLECVGEKEVLLYCAAGGRAGIVAKLLASEGFKAANAGGFSEWRDAGWPVTQPKA